MTNAFGSSQNIPLRKQVSCPHCWHLFATDQILWISESPELIGDSRLGPDGQQRFLPFRFDANAQAIDPNGFACHRFACPNCHLQIPRAFLELPPFFISIVGAPAVGKSYFLAAMTWRLRKVMPKYFGFSYTDADAELNQRLQQYESQQFLQGSSKTLVAIEKTEVYGNSYNSVLINGQEVAFPQPFTFSLTPNSQHPLFEKSSHVSRVLCLYDNAGESYLPGADSAIRPVTRHLTLSNALFFLFDPTQDARFRDICRGKTHDPQMNVDATDPHVRRSVARQETILTELVNRFRNHQRISPQRQERPPLIIVLTKADAWGFLLGDTKLTSPWRPVSNSPYHAFDTTAVEEVSAKARGMMQKMIPEIVSVAEQLTQDVVYIPVSATGGPPSVDPATGILGFRPADIKPFWAEVPVVYTLAKLTRGIVPVIAK